MASFPLLAGTGFGDIHGLTLERLAVERLDRRFGLFLDGHFDETESLRDARKLVPDYTQ